MNWWVFLYFAIGTAFAIGQLGWLGSMMRYDYPRYPNWYILAWSGIIACITAWVWPLSAPIYLGLLKVHKYGWRLP